MNDTIKRPSKDLIRTALRQLIQANGWEVRGERMQPANVLCIRQDE